jgi:hypothetical protein|tara:strand:- start:173 stop:334 length:162 start_codon:yes stop_codon:yes gene_type:complete
VLNELDVDFSVWIVDDVLQVDDVEKLVVQLLDVLKTTVDEVFQVVVVFVDVCH